MPTWFMRTWRACVAQPRHAGFHRGHLPAITPRPSRDFWTLYVLFTGTVTHITTVLSQEVRAPCSWLVPPGDACAQRSSQRVELFNCLFALHRPLDQDDPLGLLPSEPVALADPAGALHEATALAVHFHDWQPIDEDEVLRARSHLDRLLFDHARDAISAASPAHRHGPTRFSAPSWFDSLCLRMTQGMLSPGYGFANIVAAAGVSASLVARTFRQQLGTTAMGYLRQQRLALAARLLCDRPDQSIASIAARCGYASLPLFSRHFAQTYGISPRAHRRRAPAGRGAS